MYGIFKSVYRDVVGRGFKFETGEKKRVRRVFNRIAESLGERDESKFKSVLTVFRKYTELQMKTWLQWEKRDRGNLLGFLERGDEPEIYARGELKKDDDIHENDSTGSAAHDIAGRTTAHDWDDF